MTRGPAVARNSTAGRARALGLEIAKHLVAVLVACAVMLLALGGGGPDVGDAAGVRHLLWLLASIIAWVVVGHGLVSLGLGRVVLLASALGMVGTGSLAVLVVEGPEYLAWVGIFILLPIVVVTSVLRLVVPALRPPLVSEP